MIEREDAQLDAVAVAPGDDIRTKAAPLTGDLLMRGRSRARDLVQPARKSNLRPPMPPGQQTESVGEGTSAIVRSQSMREAGLLLIWVTVFFGTFLIGLSLIE
jgi:hypothetical protein